MKNKPAFILVLIVLLIVVVLCFFGSMGAMVSKNFEVDERYWRVENNRNLSAEAKADAIEALDKRGRQLERNSIAFGLTGVASLIGGCILIFKAKSILH